METKNIEKVLPTLNEMGVHEITFIYCERSQKSFKVDFKTDFPSIEKSSDDL